MSTNNNEIDLRRFNKTVKRHRRIYILSIAIIMSAAAIYCTHLSPMYRLHSTMLIEESVNDVNPGSGTGMNSLMRVFSIGSFGASSAENEKLMLSSYDIKLKTVRHLDLSKSYIKYDGLKKSILSAAQTPVILQTPSELADTLTSPIIFNIILNNEHADIKISHGTFIKKTLLDVENVKLPYEVSTCYGKFKLYAHNNLPLEKKSHIKITVSPNEAVALDLDKMVEIEQAGKLTDGLGLSLIYPNKETGIDILNTIMAEYNNKRLKRKWDNADLEIKFYDDRIQYLSKELNTTEKNIESLKKNNDLVSVENEAALLVENEFTSQQELNRLLTLRSYYESILDALKQGVDNDAALPVVSGFDLEKGAGLLITEYNDLILKRRELTRSAKGENKILKMLDSRISSLREDIITNMNEQMRASDLIISFNKKASGTVTGRIKELPTHERTYVSLLRDQKLKNELYTFLLERRENAVLNRNSTATLGFVFQDAYCEETSNKHIYMILCIALVISLLLPTFYILHVLHKDRIYDVLDFNFDNIEDHAIQMDASYKNITRLRSLIMVNNVQKTVLIYGYESEKLMTALGNSFDTMHLKTKKATTSSVEELFNQELNNENDDDYLLITAPATNDIELLNTLMTKHNAQIVLSIKSGLQKRSYIKDIANRLKGPITFVICNSNV